MNFFSLEKEQDFDFSSTNMFESPSDTLDENIFSNQDDRTQEFNSDSDSIQKALASTKKITKQTSKPKKKKFTKAEREINKREKDRQRAKRNRERKKTQFKLMEDKIASLQDENKRLLEYIAFLQNDQSPKF